MTRMQTPRHASVLRAKRLLIKTSLHCAFPPNGASGAASAVRAERAGGRSGIDCATDSSGGMRYAGTAGGLLHTSR